MQNQKLMVSLGILVVLVGVAAFIGGRLLNQRVGPIGLGMPMGNGDVMSISIQITPAPELPSTRADITGLFVERKDNTIVVQAVSFGAGVGGVSGDSPLDEDSGIKVEIVVTSASMVYKDVTQLSAPVNGEIHNVQQAVAEGTLDDLNSQTFISVWGRRSGDRIIADVLFYSNPQSIKKP